MYKHMPKRGTQKCHLKVNHFLDLQTDIRNKFCAVDIVTVIKLHEHSKVYIKKLHFHNTFGSKIKANIWRFGSSSHLRHKLVVSFKFPKKHTTRISSSIFRNIFCFFFHGVILIVYVLQFKMIQKIVLSRASSMRIKTQNLTI